MAMRPMYQAPWTRRAIGLQTFAVVASFGPLACGSANDRTVPDGSLSACLATTDAIQTQIFQPVCGASGCHSAVQPALSLDLVSPGLERRIINASSNGCADQSIVVAGDPSRSYLLTKLTQDSPPCGERMPLVGARLTADQISCLEAWISKLVPPASIDGGSDTGADATSQTGDGGADAGPACPAGQTMCGASCVDTSASTSNCGGCGKTCGTGQICSAGVCACQSGLTICSGACVDLSSSNGNCGACGHTCSGGVCSGGRCASSCSTGTTNCGGSCVSVLSSATNCGSCGYTCAAGLSCVNGGCVCPNAQSLCGSACVDTATDSSNCGTCGKVCPSGQVCTAGVCSCGPTVSFANQVQPIFSASCASAGCHTGVKPAASLSLSSGYAYAALVNVPASSCSGRIRVTPSAVPQSYLMNKLLGIDICSGTQMPKTGAALATSEINTISAWICEGAPKN
jgi:stigma-specific protein Stig1